ncbi:MAG: radical SAM protein [Planctomycetes bacterium]|nr:radical SAM protein [Planctomycetota bacterium]
MSELTVRLHDRDAAGRTYVYPVVSRRARGVSIGVNLNPNRACNWRCVYCQVPGLVRGRGPAIDLALLESELDSMLREVLEGDFMERRVPDPAMRRLNDVAFSGDGESTTSPDFGAAIEVVARVLERHQQTGRIKVVLITNGSMARRPEVRAGLRRLATIGGEAWFKFDRGRDLDIQRTNDVTIGVEAHLENLRATLAEIPCFIQTCMFARAGAPPDEDELAAWLDLLRRLLAEGLPLRGVLLYGLARASHQPEAPTLAQLPVDWMEALGERVRALGLGCQVSA